jgi:dihydroflavonol-4-reductase
MFSAMSGSDTIFHAASFYPDYSLRREQQLQTALSEFQNVIKAAKENKISRFIFISSPTVIAAGKESVESSTYCKIKYYLHKLMEDEIKNGFPGIIVIPGGCFGPGDRKVITGRVILEIISRRLRIICEGKMNVVDVRDVARSTVDAAIKGKTGSVYQMGNWNCLASEFVQKVASLAGIPPPTLKVPYKLSKEIAGFLEYLQFYTIGGKPFLPETGLDLVNFCSDLNSSLAVKDLGFTTLPIDKTLTDSIDWYKTNNYLTNTYKINFSRFPEFRLQEKFG